MQLFAVTVIVAGAHKADAMANATDPNNWAPRIDVREMQEDEPILPDAFEVR